MTVEYNQGARQNYGPYAVEQRAPGTTRTAGVYNQLVVPVNYDDLPAATEVDQVVIPVPANSLIVNAYTYVETDFNSTSGTTTIDIGLQQADGTEIDNDGIDADVVTADGSNAGWYVGDGVLVGASVGAEDGYIVVVPSVDDLTAGKGYVIVEYVQTPNMG